LPVCKVGQSTLVTRPCENSGVFRHIDSARSEEVDIGYRSIHMQSRRKLFLANARPENAAPLLRKSYALACRSDVRVTGQDK
jgi:hypothetical protein